MSREAVMSALFNLVSGATGVVTASRRVKLWSDVPADLRPALYMREPRESYQHDGIAPPVRTLLVDLLVYIAAGDDPNTAPASTLNNILDAIDTALQPDALIDNRQTLGGLVYNCRIDGEIMKDAGDIDGDGIAIIPIKIIIP